MRLSTLMRHLVLPAALVAFTACATAPAPAPVATPEAPSSEVVAPDVDAATVAELPFNIHWVRNSAEYRALYEQTFRLATEALERRVAGREEGSWAVAIDADETLISNSEQSKKQAFLPGVPFEIIWDEWVNQRSAPALPGAKSFLERVHELGGAIAVVTNRRDFHCPQTADNLRALELPFDVILCRGDEGDKAPRWEQVESGTAGPDLGPREIVMWLGDNIHDFPGGEQELRFAGPESFSDFGDRFFILPNPLYGSWEDNPQE